MKAKLPCIFMAHPTKVRYNAQRKELILAHCHYVSLPSELIDAFGECTEYLDCSHNRLINLSCLYEFTNLKYLILDNNRLHEAHFNQLQWPLPKVKLLMLNRNELMDLPRTIRLLASIFPNLEYLSLHDNPICPDELELQPFCEYVNYEYEYYRSQISSAFPYLKFLDHYDLQRSYRNCIPKSTITSENKNLTKIHVWPTFKNYIEKNNIQFWQLKGQKIRCRNFYLDKLSVLQKRGLIQTDESEGDSSITDKDL